MLNRYEVVSPSGPYRLQDPIAISHGGVQERAVFRPQRRDGRGPQRFPREDTGRAAVLDVESRARWQFATRRELLIDSPGKRRRQDAGA